MDNEFPLVTRRELVDLMRKETGIPVTYSRLMKDGASGRGPQPVATFGKRHLYRPADGLAYAKSLIHPVQAGETKLEPEAAA
jgi:hypothetical protein